MRGRGIIFNSLLITTALAAAASHPAHADADTAALVEQVKILQQQLQTQQQQMQALQQQVQVLQQQATVGKPQTVADNSLTAKTSVDVTNSGTVQATSDNAIADKAIASANPASETKAANPDAVTVKLDSTGLSVKNANNDTLMRVHGFLQADNRTFIGDHDRNASDSFELRRARLIVEGGAHGFYYNLTPDFGGSAVALLDAFAGYRYKDAFAVQMGKMKPPLGLEQLKATPDQSFVETAMPTLLMPIRDAGALLYGTINDAYFERRLMWQAGIFNGVPDNTMDNADHEDGKQGVARLYTEPFDGVGFGVSGSYGRTTGSAGTPLLPSYTSSGRQTIFAFGAGSFADGTNWRVIPQASIYEGPFGLIAEYAVSAQDVRNGAVDEDLRNKAWGAQATWVLTGEDATYKSVSPAHPFDPANGEWGAWEIGARYGKLDIDNRAFPILANPSTAVSGATNAEAVSSTAT